MFLSSEWKTRAECRSCVCYLQDRLSEQGLPSASADGIHTRGMGPLGRLFQISQWATVYLSKPHVIIFPRKAVPFWSLLGQGVPLSLSQSVGFRNLGTGLGSLLSLSTSIQTPFKSQPFRLLNISLICPNSATALTESMSIGTSQRGKRTLSPGSHPQAVHTSSSSLLCLLMSGSVIPLASTLWWVPTAFEGEFNPQISWQLLCSLF